MPSLIFCLEASNFSIIDSGTATKHGWWLQTEKPELLQKIEKRYYYALDQNGERTKPRLFKTWNNPDDFYVIFVQKLIDYAGDEVTIYVPQDASSNSLL